MIPKNPKPDVHATVLAWIQALAVHLAFFVLLLISSLEWQPFEAPTVPVRVSLVDMGPTPAEREAQEQARQQAEQQRQEEARRQAQAEREAEAARRLAAEREEARRLAEQEAEERARQEARALREAARREAEEQARLEAEARERELAELRAQLEAAQRAREEQERQLEALAQERMAKEEERRAQVEAERLRLANEQAEANARRATLREEYILTIQELIRRNWTRPPTTAVGMTCTLKVFQIPGGEIISAELVSPCNADQATRRSIETALTRVKSLPYRGYESVFEREIEFAFRYDG